MKLYLTIIRNELGLPKSILLRVGGGMRLHLCISQADIWRGLGVSLNVNEWMDYYIMLMKYVGPMSNDNEDYVNYWMWCS